MGFGDLRRILHERRRQEETGLYPVEYQKTERAKSLLKQLQTNNIIAYKERKKKWFEEHPGKQFFENTYEEFVRDCKLEEWLWYFISRMFERTPEQRYQDERNPDYGWSHKSNVHSIEEPCVEGCRFWPEEGRIEDIKVLEDYERFERYDEVFKVWNE